MASDGGIYLHRFPNQEKCTVGIQEASLKYKKFDPQCWQVRTNTTVEGKVDNGPMVGRPPTKRLFCYNYRSGEAKAQSKRAAAKHSQFAKQQRGMDGGGTGYGRGELAPKL